MNRAKWDNPAVPLETLALKLTEEAAEVGGVITDAYSLGLLSDGEYKPSELRNLIEECSHVEFIAGLIKARAKKALTA